MKNKTVISLQFKIAFLVGIVVALSLLVTNAMITSKITDIVEDRLGRNAMNVARVVAHAPSVIQMLKGEGEMTQLQVLAKTISQVTHLDVDVYDAQGQRAVNTGKPLNDNPLEDSGARAAALNGQEYVLINEKQAGYSLQALSPVFSEDGRQIGVIVVSITLDEVEEVADHSKSIIYLANTLGLSIGLVGALLLARNIKKELFGLEPVVIARLLEERNAMLQSVKEGILTIDKNGKITLVNDEALRLVKLAGITGDPVGRHVDEWFPGSGLLRVLQTGDAELDQETDINGVKVVMSRVPMRVGTQTIGALASFRDKTEIRQMAEELTGVKNYVEALRSQAHEFMNKLHVILGMVRMDCHEQLASYISRITHEQQEEVNLVGSRIKDPVIAGFILGKLSRARELGVNMNFAAESFLPESSNPDLVHDFITVVGNIIDNALEAVLSTPQKDVYIAIEHEDHTAIITVSDTGAGIREELKGQIFAKGYSTKAGNRGYGLALVQRTLARIGGRFDLISEVNHGTQFVIEIPYRGKGEDHD